MPTDPKTSASGSSFGHESDVDRAARSQRERNEKEARLHEHLRESQEEERKRARRAAEERAWQHEQGKGKTQEYRIEQHVRQSEEADRKFRQDQQEKESARMKQKYEEQQKQEKKYLHSLRDASALTIAKKHRKNALKREEESARQNAEMQHREKLKEALHAERMHSEEIEREARAHRALVDTALQTELYHLEEAHRMRLRELETELSRDALMAKAGTPQEQQKKRLALESLVRTKRQRIEKDNAEKRQELQNQVQIKRSAIDRESQAERVEAAAERQRMHRNTEQWYGDTLNDIARTYGLKHEEQKRL